MTCQLLADIGGTRARFAVLEGSRLGAIESLRTDAWPTAIDALRHFLGRRSGSASIDRALIAAAGPVVSGRCRLTNAAWVVDGKQIQQALHLKSVTIVNDLEALAWAVPHLGGNDVEFIGGRSSAAGEPVVVIAPGTGLGIACHVPGPDGARVLASEAGHATLAAHDAGDGALVEVLRRRFGHVSAERVLSGPGLANLYAAMAAHDGATPDPEEIVRRALDGSSGLAGAALDRFCSFLGAFAGDMALTFAARGGVLIGGGMAPHIVAALKRPVFPARFVAKGRFEPYLARISTGVIVRPEPTFLGLAAMTARALP